MKRLFIFGAGFSGRAIGRLIIQNNHAHTLYGTTRHEKKIPLLQQAGITPLLFDSKNLNQNTKQVLSETTHLIISIAPDETGDVVLNLADFAELKAWMPQLEWIAYLSTVGVYGDAGGALVDEEFSCTPSHPRARKRFEIEQQWQNFAQFAALPLCICRLAGIYGPGRNVFIKLRDGRGMRIIKKNQFFSRIHCDDIAGSLLHLGAQHAQGIFNIADDEPAPPQDVVTYAAKLMRQEPPPEIAFEQANLSAIARSFYADNRRISNKKLRDSGYQLRYPTYRQALKNMWQHNNWL